jgi:hypothetical protein
MNTIGPVSKRLTTFRASATVWDFTPFTEWIPAAAAMQQLRAVLRSKAEVGTFEYRLAFQLASIRPDAPGDWQTLGSTIAANNESTVTQASFGTTYTQGSMWIRFGIACRVTNATSPAFGQAGVELTVAYGQYGQVVGSGAQQVDFSGGDSHYLPMTPWIPAHCVSHVQMAASVFDETGASSWQGAYQTATTSIQSANAWALFGSAHNDGGEWNTSEVALSLTTHMWVRFGIKAANQAGQTAQFTGWINPTFSIRKA